MWDIAGFGSTLAFPQPLQATLNSISKTGSQIDAFKSGDTTAGFENLAVGYLGYATMALEKTSVLSTRVLPAATATYAAVDLYINTYEASHDTASARANLYLIGYSIKDADRDVAEGNGMLEAYGRSYAQNSCKDFE